MESQPDRPGVLIFPPLLFVIAVLLMLGLRWLWPLPITGEMIIFWIGISLLVLGVGIAVWGSLTMRKGGTNVNTYRPSTALVTGGPFRFSRNPLYIALILLFLGLSLAVNTWWGIALLVPLVVIVHFGIIVREERYLERKFAASYREYQAKVRRYL